MLKALSQFPDYSIVWRMERDVPGLSHFPHIRTMEWLPQIKLLCETLISVLPGPIFAKFVVHNRTRLFITHCGYNSLMETAHAGVPIISIPLFADQMLNGLKAEKHGFGLSVDKMDMTKPDKIVVAMNKVLGDPRLGSLFQKQ